MYAHGTSAGSFRELASTSSREPLKGPFMDTSKVGVILNPNAAGGRALKHLPKVTNTLVDLGTEFTLSVTTGRGDAWTQARQFALGGIDRVIVIGGDGTFNEAANGLLEAGTRTPLGLIPAGTGCDLPRTLGLSRLSTEQAARRAIEGSPTAIDVGLAQTNAGDRHFLNMAGMGFDATVAERSADSKIPGGLTAYMVALVTSLASYDNIPVSVQCEELSVDTRAVFVTVANAQYLAGGFQLAPMADITDGKLDLAIIGDLSVPELLRQLPRVYRGRHIDHPKFTHVATTRVRVESTQRALVQVDGEIHGEAPVEFSCCPLALDVIR
jgi:diacylglycerol kinase (ATP)